LLKRRKKKFVFRRGREERSARKRAECWSWREQFHAAELIRGGERSWIWAAVSRSMTFIVLHTWDSDKDRERLRWRKCVLR